MAVGVWSDIDRARAAVHRRGKRAARDTLHLSAAFDESPRAQMRRLLRQHIEQAVHVEWPAMSRRRRHVKIDIGTAHRRPAVHPQSLARDGRSGTSPSSAWPRRWNGALEARRQRIIISQGGVNGVKWFALIMIAAIALTGIALVHADNRLAAAIAMSLFATAVALAVLLIASHDRPFTGEVSVRPDVLLQAIPPNA